MKNEGFIKKKDLRRLSIVLIILLISFTLISGSTISINILNKYNKKNFNSVEFDEEISDRLLPKNKKNIILNDNKPIDFEKVFNNQDCPIMYGISIYSEFSKIISINTCNCSMEEICDIGDSDFFSGGTYGCDGVWYVVTYDDGGLYGIDPFNCTIWVIGGGGLSLNGLAYDPVTKAMYGVGGPGVPGQDYLVKVDPDTGEQTEIGKLGGSIYYTIGISFDAEGTLYGWDIATDSLFIINIITGEATVIVELPINLNYAQDGDIHRESNVLYMTIVTSSLEFGLIAIDLDNGEWEWICDFPFGTEVTASVFFNSCVPPDHDVSVKSIDYPESGYAIEEIPMQITVGNVGNNTETTDVQMQVIKYEEGPIIMEENFSGTFPPDGWETDYWNKSDTNISGGTVPEARVYNYDQGYGGQFYDNYIMSGQIDCTGLEKVTLKFRWAGDYDYPQYTSVYVFYRKNASSPWEDFTPWNNPIGSNQLPQLWETSCYSFDEPFGDEFQIKWNYIGYYGYFNYLWLDDIELIACSNYEEYNETVEDLEIEKGEEVIVEFPNWTPSDWQDPDFENIWQEYIVKACTLLEDDKPNNDCEDKLIDLYFPWFHDVEIKSIDSPCKYGPGKTYPVKATIRNVGQYDECCIPIDISISETFIIETLLEESSWPNPYPEVPADGWTDEHKLIHHYYGWRKSNTSNSGGIHPEVYIPYYYCREDYHFYSYAIDTSIYNELRLSFKTYIDHYHYSGQGNYALEAGYSTDKETWYTVWHEEPGSDERYDVDVSIECCSQTTYIGFWIKGNNNNFRYWYIDDVELVALNIDKEYSDHACQGPDIKPGEEVTIEFDNWTPEFLQNETSGTKDYIINCSIEREGDKNPDNDLYKKYITLDFFHDVGIKNITSPSPPFKRYVKSKTLTPMPEIYIQPGTEDIDVIVENNGTFPEFDLTCHAEIWDFITNGNGSLVYEDEIIDIDLEEPNGGTKLLNFDDFTFVEEGVYGLFIDLPHEIDDYPENNQKNLFIGVDDSDPYSWIEKIDPPEPNGNNGWYTSEVEVTICAEDPEIQEGIPGSGIYGIIVRYNGGNEQIIYDDCITIILDEENSYLEFYAVDCAGNKETPKHLEIKIDQTPPEIILSHEIVGGNKLQGWDFEFTATAFDALSGMDYVEFYQNDILQKTVEGPGPEYKWTFKHPDGKNVTIKSIGYDKAGLFNSDEIKDPKTSYKSFAKNYNYQYSIFIILNKFLERFPFLQKLLDILEDFN